MKLFAILIAVQTTLSNPSGDGIIMAQPVLSGSGCSTGAMISATDSSFQAGFSKFDSN